MSELDKRWWFVALTYGAAGMATSLLFKLADYPHPSLDGAHTFPQFLVFACCFGVLQRFLSFVTWLVLAIAFPHWPREKSPGR